MIACGHCGGEHATVAEVRSCSMGDLAASSPAGQPITSERRPGTPDSRAATPVHPSPREVPEVVLDPDWQRLAGPDALARNIVINPGDPVPEPWLQAETVAADARDDAEAIEVLRRGRAERRRLVIELDGPLPAAAPVLDVDFWHLSPETDLEGEVLRHLVLDHSVDARDADRPTIAAVSHAVAAGGTVSAPGGLGDVQTPDGPAWCDGGPLTFFSADELDAPVIPAANLAVGSLVPTRHATPTADLAPDQLAAVAHSGGGARIIAPAGSGKTRVLTERARHLVRDRGIDPRAICLVAFNVRAREEMEDRTRDLPGLEVRTLNSLALAIVSGRAPFVASEGRRAPAVIDEHEVRRVLDSLVKTRRQAMADPMASWIEALTSARLGLRSPAAVEQEFAPDVKDFARVLPAYRERLRRAGRVDFDEQILGAIEVLCTDPAARAAARRACGVLLVDEFQDLTPAHVLLIRLLAGPRADVFGVGDDDQTIYGYSGASPEWLIDYTDLFPGSGAHDLAVNYRCPPEVVRAAHSLLTHNRRRIAKDIHARPDRASADGSLHVVEAPDPLPDMVRRVQALVESGARAQDIAVLTRVNATLLGPMLLLGQAGIATNAPVHAQFVERTGVAGALAWLDLATAPAERMPPEALETAVRRPPRGISSRLAGWVGEQRSVRDLRALAGRLNNQRDQQKISAFAADVEALRNTVDGGATTATVLEAVRDTIGLGHALDNRLDASRRSVDRSAHGDDLAALIAVADQAPDPAAFGQWLRSRLGEIPSDPRGVRLSTIHRVKGREWPHVFVYDATMGLMPHRLASDREEERRVFHVAITRGSQSVTVVPGDPPSPFIAELSAPRDPNAPWEREPHTGGTARGGASAPPRARAKKEVPEASSIVEATLREKLRTWRSARARADSVPAFVVFNDATLMELARLRPLDDDALLDVAGIGPVKVEKYGSEIVEVIAAELG